MKLDWFESNNQLIYILKHSSRSETATLKPIRGLL
nr:MAG TPA: hypothetical protein [Caudoviricetes sp.]